MPGHTLKQRAVQGVINPLNKMIVAPYLDIFEVPEIFSLLVAGYKKNLEGKVKFTT